MKKKEINRKEGGLEALASIRQRHERGELLQQRWKWIRWLKGANNSIITRQRQIGWIWNGSAKSSYK
jgi:hypothetical protein